MDLKLVLQGPGKQGSRIDWVKYNKIQMKKREKRKGRRCRRRKNRERKTPPNSSGTKSSPK
jgi:hypothetical protein